MWIEQRVQPSEKKLVDACLWIKLGKSLPSGIRLEYMLKHDEDRIYADGNKREKSISYCVQPLSSHRMWFQSQFDASSDLVTCVNQPLLRTVTSAEGHFQPCDFVSSCRQTGRNAYNQTYKRRSSPQSCQLLSTARILSSPKSKRIGIRWS